LKVNKSNFLKAICEYDSADLSPSNLKSVFPEFSDLIDSEVKRLNEMINFEKNVVGAIHESPVISPFSTLKNKFVQNNGDTREEEATRLKRSQIYATGGSDAPIAVDSLFSTNLAGVDEAGRGPLCGPVVAAAVCFKKYPFIPFVNDSKKMTAKAREFAANIIFKKAFVGIGLVSAEKIDEINILQASFEAMKLALADLVCKVDFVLVDGNKTLSDLTIPQKAVVKGDSKSFSIACASIIAKVTRDKILSEYDKLYPDYGFAKHKGYGTAEHIEAIKKWGLIERFHRKTFCKFVENCGDTKKDWRSHSLNAVGAIHESPADAQCAPLRDYIGNCLPSLSLL